MSALVHSSFSLSVFQAPDTDSKSSIIKISASARSDLQKHLIENEKKDREGLFQNDSVLAQFLYLETIL